MALYTAPFSDGSPAASQWPIPPRHFFDYEIYPEKGSAGSTFYHSHVGLQAGTAAGALIIEDQTPPPFKYDEDRIIFLTDYYNRTDKTMEEGLVANPFVWQGETNNVLVNGFGKPINSTSPAVGTCKLETISVEPGKTYRLRFISSTSLSFLSIGLEGHGNLTIIEVDGHYVKPTSTNLLQIGSGQRYSILFRAKSQAELNEAKKQSYFLQMETRERPTNLTSYAVISYSGNSTVSPPSTSPLTLPPTIKGWLDYDISPLEPYDLFPTVVSRSVVLSIFQNNSYNATLTEKPQYIWSVLGNIPWYDTTPHKPLLVALYQKDQSILPNHTVALANGGYDPVKNAFTAKMGEVIDILIEAAGMARIGDVHPFHLHGAHFWDLGSGVGPYNATSHRATMAAAAAKGWAPIKRDTSMLYRGNTTVGTVSDWRLWRVKVTDPGVWMLHCHTLSHMVMGMQSLWMLGDAGDLAPLPAGSEQSYLVYGGDAYGNANKSARVVDWYA